MEAHDMAGHLIRRMHQRSTHIFMQHMQAAGLDLTPVQFAAMDAVRSHPGIDQIGVAQLIAYDRTTISGVIDRLVHKGLVARVVSRRDRRARELSLTEEGARLFAELLPVVRELQSEILANLDPSRQAEFLDSARSIVAED
ncbi:MAG: MarR family transcriptional regulator [Hyphomicrobiales bacterium]|nr:MAG: MarR family transcriptional regulator [Hyphomicrobiales bacterium]